MHWPLAALDGLPLDPSSVAQLGVAGVLAVGFALLATGKLIPEKTSDKAERRADKLQDELFKTVEALRAMTDAQKATNQLIQRVVDEHEEERRVWASELAGLQRELSRLAR